MAVSYFCRTFHHKSLRGFWTCLGFSTWQGSENTWFFQYPRVLNIPVFWICQGYKYKRILNMPLILNLPEFWICLWFSICQGSEYTRILNMSGLKEGVERFWKEIWHKGMIFNDKVDWFPQLEKTVL